MKPLIFLGCLCLCFMATAQYTYKNLEVNFNYTDAQLKNYTYKNLQLYPIRAKQSFVDTFGRLGKYLSLKEALEQKKVVITEQIGGSTVNTLTIENISSDTVLIMAGEVITGGKQNRIIGKDLLLVPHSGKIDISVYCVEAGRWENASTGTNQFAGYYNVGSFELRKMVDKDSGQRKVWSKVDQLNAANNTHRSNATKTYTAISQSKDFNNALKEYTDYFKRQLTNEKNIIGVIIVSGNKVMGCDMFATPDLFSKNLDNLLASYATEAILNGATVTAKPSNVKSYMDRLLNSEEQQAATLKEKGKAFVSDGKKLRVTSYQ